MSDHTAKPSRGDHRSGEAARLRLEPRTSAGQTSGAGFCPSSRMRRAGHMRKSPCPRASSSRCVTRTWRRDVGGFFGICAHLRERSASADICVPAPDCRNPWPSRNVSANCPGRLHPQPEAMAKGESGKSDAGAPTPMKLAEIAVATRDKSESSFGKAFRRVTGVSNRSTFRR